MSGTVIVTGASRGIGAAVARLAARRGHDVAINYNRSPDAAQRVQAECRAEGVRAITVQGDMAREEDVLRLFERADAELPPLCGLVNNAGITGAIVRLADLERAELMRVLEINVAGYFLCAREAVLRLSTARGGSGGAIVNVSSRAADLGSPGEWIHYAASKGATDSLTIGLAREVATEGVRVNAVQPGLIETDIHAAAGVPERAARLAPTVPMRRSGTAEEVAETVLFLLSPAASYVTGAVLPVSGGR